MATQGILDTGLLADDETGVTSANSGGGVISDYNPGQTGVFALHPLMTPKYARNNGLRDAEFKETLARLYISLADASENTKKLYLKSLPKNAQVQALAKVLIGSGAGSGGGSGFIDFFLGQAQENFQEKMQVDEVLSDNYVVFYFGQQAPVFNYAGYLLNSQQDDQVTGFALAYQHLIRGSQLARKGALLRLRYNGVIVSGTVNTMTTSLGAENELAVPFNFSLLVKEYAILRQPNFVKLSQDDFVALSTQFDPDGVLRQVGQAKDARVRTTILSPLTLAAESVAGADESGEPVDENLTAPEQLQSQISQASQPASPTTNVRGTLPANNQSVQPPAPLASFPPGG